MLECQWILRIRELRKSTCLRVFCKPLINFDAQNNESLITIEYSNASFTFVNEIGGLVEPSIAADLTDDELRRYVEVPLRTPFPCNQ